MPTGLSAGTACLLSARSFSSMSDITGKGGGPRGEGSSGGDPRPVRPALLSACVPLPEALLSPRRTGGLCSGGPWGSWFTLILPQSFLPVLAGPYGLFNSSPPSTLHPLPGNPRVILGPGSALSPVGPLCSWGLWALGLPWAWGAQPFLVDPGSSPLLSRAPLNLAALPRECDAEALVPRPLLFLILR